MHALGQAECLEFALKKLQSHPGLKGALSKIRQLYQKPHQLPMHLPF